jgi:hypothetical protein
MIEIDRQHEERRAEVAFCSFEPATQSPVAHDLLTNHMKQYAGEFWKAAQRSLDADGQSGREDPSYWIRPFLDHQACIGCRKRVVRGASTSGAALRHLRGARVRAEWTVSAAAAHRCLPLEDDRISIPVNMCCKVDGRFVAGISHRIRRKPSPSLTGQSRKNYFSYSQPDSKQLVMQRLLETDSLVVRLRRIDESSFLLVNRGFHWINEIPFNR